MQHAIVRNPEMATQLGFSDEDRTKMALTLSALDQSGQLGWQPMVDEIRGMWTGFNEWAAQKGKEYREEERMRTQ